MTCGWALLSRKQKCLWSQVSICDQCCMQCSSFIMSSYLCLALWHAVRSPAGLRQSYSPATGHDQRAVTAGFTVHQVLLAVILGSWLSILHSKGGYTADIPDRHVSSSRYVYLTNFCSTFNNFPQRGSTWHSGFEMLCPPAKLLILFTDSWRYDYAYDVIERVTLTMWLHISLNRKWCIKCLSHRHCRCTLGFSSADTSEGRQTPACITLLLDVA